MSPVTSPNLFTPLVLSPQVTLSHRVVLAPLTRCRAVGNNVPNDLMGTYYEQRATEGSLLISEGTAINEYAHTGPNIPGIYNDNMEAGWKKIVKRVHDKKGIFFMQLWHCGRSSQKANMPNGEAPYGPSAVQANFEVVLPDGTSQRAPEPREMSLEVIKSTIDDFKQGAARARRAGFDGVEIHGANGYLVDQFLQNGTNIRTDHYGGSIENRARFLIETVEATIAGMGGEAGRVGIRLAPWGIFGDISTTDTVPLFTYVLKELNKFKLAYVHVVEPRIMGSTDRADADVAEEQVLQPFRDAYSGNFIVAGGYLRDSAEKAISSGYADAVAFGRYYISNPDFVERLRNNITLTPYNRATFYTQDSVGYTDYSEYNAQKL
ncbi:hypothetical protein PhCBS80983_g01153 [Powellomyces hirtus]|uniref:NADH:flavin oxidoreductase/NADH oxidase N-terminal domain-containing protein n=1 Tax=Powellomyces hirtus TaxID=109895 RepID=A0A507EC28_9FUNG|nr:hypothetical protein PhCBS80983_g01153 [Powellomyces hirtus]